MTILRLTDAAGTAAAAASALGSVRALQKSYTLLELFLQASGVRHVHRQLACSGPDTDLSLLSYVALLSQLMYPL